MSVRNMESLCTMVCVWGGGQRCVGLSNLRHDVNGLKYNCQQLL